MKSVQLAASILIMLSSVSAGAESWLRPDTQEPQCLGNTEQNPLVKGHNSFLFTSVSPFIP